MLQEYMKEKREVARINITEIIDPSLFLPATLY